MNWVDVVIIGGVTLVGLAGLGSGLLRPASGIGGLVLGVILAVQHHESLAFVLADHVEGENVRRLAAFAVITLTTTIAVRLSAAAVKRILSYLVLGWIDWVAGALAGAAVAVMVFGTATYLIDGADISQVREPFQQSRLVEAISQVSFIKTQMPWCSNVESSRPLRVGEECADLSTLAGDVFGTRVSDTVRDLIGYDAGTVAAVVKTSLSGSRQDVTNLVQQKGLVPAEPESSSDDERPAPE